MSLGLSSRGTHRTSPNQQLASGPYRQRKPGAARTRCVRPVRVGRVHPDGRVPVDVILSRHESGQLHALAEAVMWAWSFGLGAALVEAGGVVKNCGWRRGAFRLLARVPSFGDCSQPSYLGYEAGYVLA